MKNDQTMRSLNSIYCNMLNESKQITESKHVTVKSKDLPKDHKRKMDFAAALGSIGHGTMLASNGDLWVVQTGDPEYTGNVEDDINELLKKYAVFNEAQVKDALPDDIKKKIDDINDSFEQANDADAFVDAGEWSSSKLADQWEKEIEALTNKYPDFAKQITDYAYGYDDYEEPMEDRPGSTQITEAVKNKWDNDFKSRIEKIGELEGWGDNVGHSFSSAELEVSGKGLNGNEYGFAFHFPHKKWGNQWFFLGLVVIPGDNSRTYEKFNTTGEKYLSRPSSGSIDDATMKNNLKEFDAAIKFVEKDLKSGRKITEARFTDDDTIDSFDNQTQIIRTLKQDPKIKELAKKYGLYFDDTDLVLYDVTVSRNLLGDDGWDPDTTIGDLKKSILKVAKKLMKESSLNENTEELPQELLDKSITIGELLSNLEPYLSLRETYIELKKWLEHFYLSTDSKGYFAKEQQMTEDDTEDSDARAIWPPQPAYSSKSGKGRLNRKAEIRASAQNLHNLVSSGDKTLEDLSYDELQQLMRWNALITPRRGASKELLLDKLRNLYYA